MGLDVLIGIIGIASLSVLAYFVGRRLGRTASHRRPLLFVESLLLSLAFAWTLEGKLSWAVAIPMSAAICWSNFLPVLLSFTAGLASWSPGLGDFKRPIVVASLGMIATAYILVPVIRPIAAPANVDVVGAWKHDICLQSHPSTCGAASAATLLRRNGVPATEHEMIDACLTSNVGTVPLGLYRGLSLKAATVGKRAAVASRQPNDWIELDQLPNVALVRFDAARFDAVRVDSSGSQRSVDWLLGPSGEGHAVTVMGRTDAGRWIIGDPAIGRVYWTDTELRSHFTGDAVYLKAEARR